MKKMSNVIIGAAYGYSEEDLDPFLFSLRKHFFEKVILLVKPGHGLKNLQRRFGIDLFEDDTPVDLYALHRYFAYRNVLSRIAFDRVFFVDTRDVIFQKSPFTVTFESDIQFFLENSLIKDCEYNSKWLIDLYGLDLYSKICLNEIICSGTIMANKIGSLSFLNSIIDEISTKCFLKNFDKYDDQTITNKLVYTNRFNKFELFRSGFGLVQTLHHQKYLVLDRASRILNYDYTVCPVVHQWDRVDFLADAFKKTCYVDYNVSPPPYWMKFDDL